MAVLQCRIRKIRLPNLARDESSDDDSVNCSEISAVTWFGIFSRFLKIETFVFFTPPYCSSSLSKSSSISWRPQSSSLLEPLLRQHLLYLQCKPMGFDPLAHRCSLEQALRAPQPDNVKHKKVFDVHRERVIKI